MSWSTSWSTSRLTFVALLHDMLGDAGTVKAG